MVSEAVAESTAGPTKGTMDSTTLEQQPQHHYKLPYLCLANSFTKNIDSLTQQQFLGQDNLGLYCQSLSYG
jgi:hypothetical protein